MKLKVSLVAGKTCFVSLPPFLADDLLNRHGDALKAGAIEVTWASQNRSAETAIGRATQSGPTQQVALLSWAGGSSRSNEHLEISPTLAECIGLHDEVVVEVRLRKDVAAATRISVEPVSEDDWEVVELNAEHLEEQLLNQVRLVSAGQLLPLWIRASTLVRLSVVSVSCGGRGARFGLLGPDSEVVVAPKVRARREGAGGMRKTRGKGALLRVHALHALRLPLPTPPAASSSSERAAAGGEPAKGREEEDEEGSGGVGVAYVSAATLAGLRAQGGAAEGSGGAGGVVCVVVGDRKSVV